MAGGKVPRFTKMMNTAQYVTMRNEAFHNDGIEPTAINAPDLVLWDTTRCTNWQKELLGKAARFTTITAAISGGSEWVQYRVGFTHLKETTVFPGDFRDKKNSIAF